MKQTLKIKKGDTVYVAKGKDRGKQGKVLRVYPDTQKVMVDGVNQKTRHARPRRAGEKGQKITVLHPVRVANIRLICSSCGKHTRVGFRITDGTKVRICKKCEASLS